MPVPDFRSPNTGLYANLARLNLPHAEAVFDISYFRQNPEPFYVLAKELYPGQFHPTISHVFIALLASKGLLFHLFTQNIDCLERVAGVPPELIVEAHGSFATQRCIDCGTAYPDALMKEHVSKGEVPRCIRRNDVGGDGCNGLVKPDIVFFGEQLPAVFRARQHYAGLADLVLIMGTSLQVHPFAGLPDAVPEDVPRVLFNLERVGSLGTTPDDVLCLGDCDSGVRELADALGWRDELEEMWRGVVGDEEAERQLKNALTREEDMEDEVGRLAEEVEEVLHLGAGGSNVGETNETREDREGQETDEDTQATPEQHVRDRDVGQTTDASGDDVSGKIIASTEPHSSPDVESTPAPESDSSGSSKVDGENKDQGQRPGASSTESDANEKEVQTSVSNENQGNAANSSAWKAAL